MTRSIARPAIANASLSDVELLLIGIYNSREQEGLTHIFQDAANIPVAENVKPFDFSRTQNVFEDYLERNPDGMNINEIHTECAEKWEKALKDLGMESILEDGIVDPKEFMLVGATLGNKELQTNPEKYQNITQEQYEAAQRFVEKHGVDDPDGSIARGVAVNIERVTQRTNTGLGFNPDGTEIQTPELTASSAPRINTAPTELTAAAP